MKARLLIFALLAAPLPALAKSISNEDLDRVEAQATLWQDWQVRAASMESAFVDNVVQKSKDSDAILNKLADDDKWEANQARALREWHDAKIAARSGRLPAEVGSFDTIRP